MERLVLPSKDQLSHKCDKAQSHGNTLCLVMINLLVELFFFSHLALLLCIDIINFSSLCIFIKHTLLLHISHSSMYDLEHVKEFSFKSNEFTLLSIIMFGH